MALLDELRNGNWINLNGVERKVTEEINTNVILQDEMIYGKGHTLNPVELTEKWLINYGFRKLASNENHRYIFYAKFSQFKGIHFEVIFDTDTNKYSCSKIGEGYYIIAYVHELQNMYLDITEEKLLSN